MIAHILLFVALFATVCAPAIVMILEEQRWQYRMRHGCTPAQHRKAMRDMEVARFEDRERELARRRSGAVQY
jgi:hypothetical protein